MQQQQQQQSSSADWAASNPPQGCKCLFSLQENILSFSCRLWAATVSKCGFIRSAIASRKREEIKASHQPNHISCVPSTPPLFWSSQISTALEKLAPIELFSGAITPPHPPPLHFLCVSRSVSAAASCVAMPTKHLWHQQQQKLQQLLPRLHI